jgi:hypothetical protein
MFGQLVSARLRGWSWHINSSTPYYWNYQVEVPKSIDVRDPIDSLGLRLTVGMTGNVDWAVARPAWLRRLGPRATAARRSGGNVNSHC